MSPVQLYVMAAIKGASVGGLVATVVLVIVGMVTSDMFWVVWPTAGYLVIVLLCYIALIVFRLGVFSR